MKITFWPLLLLIAGLGLVVLVQSPQNLSVIPYKLLILCIAVYAANRIDVVFFGRPDVDDALARAIVYGATVIALAMAL